MSIPVGGLSESDAKSLLNLLLGGTTYTTPSTYYIGLARGDLSYGSDDFTDANEVDAADYDRVELTNNTTNFPAATNHGDGNRATKTNGVEVDFGTSQNVWADSQDPVKYAFLATTADNSGRIVAFGRLAQNGSAHDQEIPVGIHVRYAVGTMVFNLR